MFFLLLPLRLPPTSTLFPYTTLFRSDRFNDWPRCVSTVPPHLCAWNTCRDRSSHRRLTIRLGILSTWLRSEEHTSELQSRGHLVCRLLLEKKKKKLYDNHSLYKTDLL